MKVCDRHPRMRSTETIVIASTDAHYDLCAKCAKQVIEFLSKVKQETVEPKRRLLGFGKKVASQGA